MNTLEKLAGPAIAPFALLLALSGPVRADIAPPERSACDGKAVGAACTVRDKAGTCQDSTCSRTDQRTGQTTTYPCRQCIIATPPDAGPAAAQEDTGCAMAPGARAVGPWFLAGGFALLVLRFRRRR